MIYLIMVILVQLVIEVLPISSSSHVSLAQKLMGLSSVDALPEYMDHLLHGPTFIVIAVFFYHDWKKYFWSFFSLFGLKSRYGKKVRLLAVKLIALIFVATMPTALLYFVIKEFCKNVYWMHGDFMQFVGMVITASFLLSLRLLKGYPKKNRPLSFFYALILGVVQGFALLPGISRFGSTYAAARWLGFMPQRSIHLSFLLYAPVGGAAFLRGLVKLFHLSMLPSVISYGVIGAFFVGGIVSFFVFRWVYSLAIRDLFWIFGIYMIIPIALSVYYLVF